MKSGPDSQSESRSRGHRPRRSVVLLSEVLRRALPDRARARIYSIELLQRQWERSVGHDLARRSEPEALQDGVLTVRVVDPAWGRMILKFQHRIVSSVNRAAGERLVRRVQFVRRERLQTIHAVARTFSCSICQYLERIEPCCTYWFPIF